MCTSSEDINKKLKILNFLKIFKAFLNFILVNVYYVEKHEKSWK